jgi:hypothetical protein
MPELRLQRRRVAVPLKPPLLQPRDPRQHLCVQRVPRERRRGTKFRKSTRERLKTELDTEQRQPGKVRIRDLDWAILEYGNKNPEVFD